MANYGPTPSVAAGSQFQFETTVSYHTVKYTPSADLAAGAVVMVGSLPMVSKVPIPAHTEGTLWFLGGGNLVKDTSVFAQGDPIYWNPTGNPVGGVAGSGTATSVALNHYLIGFAGAAALTGDATVLTQLHVLGGTALSVVNQLTNAIADPGNAGAIPVTVGGYVPLVTAGAETRTLAAPTFAGQQLLLTFQTKVGNCVITCATTVNATGNNTITLSAAGQAVLLTAKVNGANLRWSVVSNDGAALSTV